MRRTAETLSSGRDVYIGTQARGGRLYIGTHTRERKAKPFFHTRYAHSRFSMRIASSFGRLYAAARVWVYPLDCVCISIYFIGRVANTFWFVNFVNV